MKLSDLELGRGMICFRPKPNTENSFFSILMRSVAHSACRRGVWPRSGSSFPGRGGSAPPFGPLRVPSLRVGRAGGVVSPRSLLGLAACCLSRVRPPSRPVWPLAVPGSCPLGAAVPRCAASRPAPLGSQLRVSRPGRAAPRGSAPWDGQAGRSARLRVHRP